MIDNQYFATAYKADLATFSVVKSAFLCLFIFD